MPNVSEYPEYTRLINRDEIKQIKKYELTQVLALLTTTLSIGTARNEEERKRVIAEGVTVLNSFPNAKEAAKEELGDEWFYSVFATVVTSN